MDLSELHKLPKEILIKLIYTIREDTIKEISDKKDQELIQKLKTKELNVMICNYCPAAYSHFYDWKLNSYGDPVCKKCNGRRCLDTERIPVGLEKTLFMND